MRWALGHLRGKHVLALLDACHSGEATDQLRAANQALADSLWAQAGVIVLASSSAAESSWESPDWEHGAITRALLEALSGEAGKRLPPGTLADYVGGRVRQSPIRVCVGSPWPRHPTPAGKHWLLLRRGDGYERPTSQPGASARVPG